MASHGQSARDQVREKILDHRETANQFPSREYNDGIDVDNSGSFPGTRETIRDLIMRAAILIASEETVTTWLGQELSYQNTSKALTAEFLVSLIVNLQYSEKPGIGTMKSGRPRIPACSNWPATVL